MSPLREEDRGQRGLCRRRLALVTQRMGEGAGSEDLRSRKEPKGARSHSVWKIPVQGYNRSRVDKPSRRLSSGKPDNTGWTRQRGRGRNKDAGRDLSRDVFLSWLYSNEQLFPFSTQCPLNNVIRRLGRHHRNLWCYAKKKKKKIAQFH